MNPQELEQLRNTANLLESRFNFAAAKETWLAICRQIPADAEALSALQRINSFQKLEAECLAIISRLLAVGIALAETKDLVDLMSLILATSREITCSDAGSMYVIDRFDPNHTVVRFLVAQNDSQPERTLSNFALPLNHDSLVGYVALTKQSLNIPDAQSIPDSAPYRHHRSFDQDIEYVTRSVVVVPMQNSQGEVIGVMQLINRKINSEMKITIDNASEVTQPFSEWEVGVVRSLANQAALVIERNQLLAQPAS
jgi:GAF domain-containing protein